MTRSLFFAPHPDDEVIGAGAHLSTSYAQGDLIRVVVVSDGAAGGDKTVRRAECCAGAEALGLPPSLWTFWDFADGALPLNSAIQGCILQQVRAFRPHRIYLPATSEQHPDHRRLTRAIILTLAGRWQGELWFYETVSPMPVVNRLQAADAAWPKKLAAMRCHESQQLGFDYLALIDAMGSLRATGARCDKAEAFLQFDWDGSPQNFFENTPLLSVVVRASQAAFLVHALASLERQQYEMLEVVLVWFGDGEPPLDAAPTLQIRQVEGIANRGANLNRGVAAASGEFIAILDEDDVVDPEHYVDLMSELRADPRIDVVYSGARLCRCRWDGESVLVEGEISRFTEAVTPTRLLLGNVVPIHAFLCRSSLLRSYPFDEALEAYEDWDLLLRLAFDGKQFAQLEGVTAEYRLFGDDADLRERHLKRGYEKWSTQVQQRYIVRLNPTHLAHWYETQQQLKAERDEERAKVVATQAELIGLRRRAQQSDQRDRLLGRVATCANLPRSASEVVVRLSAEVLAQGGPSFCIVLPVYNTEPALLEEVIQSVLDQAYRNWQLCIVDDGSRNQDTLAALDRMAKALAGDTRVQFRAMPQNSGIVATSNYAAGLVDARWIAFLDHDDRLHPDALFEIALALAERPDARLVYTDNRLIDRAGALLNTYSKPDWSPTLLLSCNYINHFTVIDRTLFAEIGGLNDEYEGAQDYGLVLACVRRLRADQVVHIPRALYDWRTTATSVSYDAEQKPHSAASSFKAIERHLAALEFQHVATTWNGTYPGIYATWRPKPRSVHIVVVSRDREADLARLLAALLGAELGDYRVTVVLNRAPESYAQDIQQRYGEQAHINWLRDDRPVNWSAAANRAARASTATHLLFLSDEITPYHADAIWRMQRFLELPDVGIVGARIHGVEGGIAHLGVLMDSEHIATDIRDAGARHERAVSREVSAVRRDVMLVDANLFEEIGGFDERLSAAFADVDFCLHARAMGKSVVLAADVAWQCHAMEPPDISLRQWEAERAAMRAKWRGEMLTEKYDTHYRIESRTTRILHVPGAA